MLSTTTEHALRALVYLAREADRPSALGRDIAAQAHIPANYLSKILWTLRNAGLLETARGLGGGYRLARPAEDIRLIEVLRLFERPRSGGGCLLGGHHECSDSDPCSAHAAWKKVKETYTDFLHSTTLADIGGSDAEVAAQFGKMGQKAMPPPARRK